MKDLKAWAIFVKNVQTQKRCLFMRGEDGVEKMARILKTKKQAQREYPAYKPERIIIKKSK